MPTAVMMIGTTNGSISIIWIIRLIASAEGMHYTTVDGRKVIDGSAGLWCVNAGHGRREIADAVQRQLMALDYAPSFQIGHPFCVRFRRKVGGDCTSRA